MPLINLSLKHEQTFETARNRMQNAVHDIRSQFKVLIHQVEWADDQSRARLTGIGFWVEMWVDDQEVHVSGDIPMLGGLLSSPLTAGLKQIVQQTFQKRLT
ncbi:MAG: polyhydroxyalkanoic acid system family protein [Candidatus Tectomicrobia bacterium]|nr:polyhydroxyalkanoic acid system family protein [Candidatus Tectomicrobia bacterium]